jgi:N-acetylmuramoyl-L-alanine amidase
MARFINIIIILGVIAGVCDYTPPISHAATTNPVDTTTHILVADGAEPQAIDYTSRILDPITAPKQFTALVLQWQANGNLASIQLAVRIQTATGWGEWQALSPNDEFADPNAPANQATSTMISTDIPATAWQAQIMLPPNSVSYVTQISAITMNTLLPNATRRILPSAAFSSPNGSKPPIVARTTWGDSELAAWDQRAANGETTDATWLPEPAEIAKPTMITIHHTATPNDALGSDWAARVRSIWRYHTITHGWGDIGYHFLIDPNGVIYSGRLNGVRDNGTVIDGAHVLGYNRANIGISMMGTFSDVAPTTAAQNALNSLIAWITTTYHITPNTTAYYAYKNVTLNTIVGHRDIGTTTCPGGVLYDLIPSIRVTAAINTGNPPSDNWIDTVTVNTTTLFPNETAEFTINVRNNYSDGTKISGAAFSFATPDTNYTFNQDECWAKKDSKGITLFNKPLITTSANQRIRVMAGYSSWDNTYANVATKCPTTSTVNHPWRWSIGSSPLTAGATRSVVGRVRFTTIGTYTIYFGIVKDWIGYPDSACNSGGLIGACAIKPITIRVIARPTATTTATITATPTITPSPTMTPSTTPVAAIRTRIVAATTTMESIQANSTVQALAVSQTIIADRLTATAIRTQGLSTHTATATALKTATATPIPLMQSVIALRGATQTVVVALTGTTSANRNAIATQQQAQRNNLTQTAFTKNTATAQQKQFWLSATPFAKQTQTAFIATQRSNNSTSTAEVILHYATRTATPSRTVTLSPTRTSTSTITSTRTITNTRTATSTNTSTVTKTVSPTSVSVIIPNTVATLTLSGNIAQVVNNQQHFFALTGNDTASPNLETVALTDFTRQTPFAIDGLSANLMSINQTDDNQLVIMGRLTWNTLFVQRLDVSVNPAHETGYWTIVSPATPSALVVSGRYIYIAMTQTVPNSPISQTTLVTLANDDWLHELTPRIALPGPVSVMHNSDSSEFGLMIAGTTANNKGYLEAGRIQNGRLIIGAPLTVPLRINQIVSQQQITGLTPQNMLFTSDGISVVQYQLDISTQAFLRLSTQSIANLQIVLMTNPTQLLAVSNVAPWQVLLYNVLSQGIIARGTAVIAQDQPTHLLSIGQWLVWNTNNMLYRAQLNR